MHPYIKRLHICLVKVAFYMRGRYLESDRLFLFLSRVMDEAASAAPFVVGGRCICDGYCATVRYIGEVPPAKGLWLGVEWDDPTRGKHSGENNDRQYFTCSQPGSGSFVRPRKVSLGYTFIAALKERYSSGLYEEELRIETKGGSVGVEMVGAQHITAKQSQFEQLHDVSLSGMLVSSAGPPGKIKRLAPNIQSLGLSQTPLLTDWKVVADIIVQLKHLHSLQLSENLQLSLPSSSSSCLEMTEAFRSLRVLFFNKIKGFAWSKVSPVLALASNLQELHFCENSISHIPSCGGEGAIPKGLQLLNLEENLLTDWSEVMHLQHLPNLKTLILNDNQFTKLFFAGQQDVSCFPALESLSLTGNLIADWSSVDALNRLLSLRELKFNGNPLLKDEPTFTARQLMIARVSSLAILNSSPVRQHSSYACMYMYVMYVSIYALLQISERERLLAERYYVKTHAAEWLTSRDSGTSAAFTALHPRFPRLVEVHGLPEEALKSQKAPSSTLKEGLICVVIRCPDSPDQKEVNKKLPATMTVQKLKGLLQRLYKVDTSDQKLSYIDKRGELSCEVELNDDLKQLSFYSIETGDTIFLRW